MNQSRVMKERIKRVRVLFHELGYRCEGREEEDKVYAGTFKSEDGFEGGYLIDRECRFLELAFSFQFGEDIHALVREKLEEMLAVCYDYGCYISLDKPDAEMAFSIYSKIYYSGLTYQTLRDTLYDFMDCVDTLAETLGLAEEEDEAT